MLSTWLRRRMVRRARGAEYMCRKRLLMEWWMVIVMKLLPRDLQETAGKISFYFDFDLTLLSFQNSLRWVSLRFSDQGEVGGGQPNGARGGEGSFHPGWKVHTSAEARGVRVQVSEEISAGIYDYLLECSLNYLYYSRWSRKKFH